jgi:hypothetical protein
MLVGRVILRERKVTRNAKEPIHRGADRKCDPSARSGRETAEICRRLGIHEQTFLRWRAKYGAMNLSEARRLQELEDENRASSTL